MPTPSRRSPTRLASRLAWLAVLALTATALIAPAASAAGPGNDGNGWPDGGPTSNASVDEDPTLVAGGATMNSATITCSGTSVTSVSGSFTLTEEFDDDAIVVVYLAPASGSNATPLANVTYNYQSVAAAALGAYPFVITVAQPFTVTSGGIQVVFAVNDDGTVISSSKSNALNCPTGPTDPPTGPPSGDPTPTPTGSAQRASILIAKVDNNGTTDPSDDVLLAGAEFEVLLDDGDGIYEPGPDALAFGEDEAVDGLLDTDPLVEGRYWIDETIVPDGYVGSDPILVELNLDSSQTCVYDALGLIECTPNEGEPDGPSWTVVIVDNTPDDGSTGGVGGATGRPRLTLPPTDLAQPDAAPGIGDGWRFALIGIAALLAATLLLTPARLVRREDRVSR